MFTPLFRHIYNTKCIVGRRTASVSMVELLQLLLDGVAICTSLSLCSPVKGLHFICIRGSHESRFGACFLLGLPSFLPFLHTDFF